MATIVIFRMSTLPDLDRPVQLDERGRRLPERAEPEQRDRLEQERDGERRDEHHGGRLRA